MQTREPTLTGAPAQPVPPGTTPPVVEPLPQRGADAADDHGAIEYASWLLLLRHLPA